MWITIAVLAGCGGEGDESGASASNTAPTISGTPPTTVQQGQAYSFQPTASDADGDALLFSISGKPGWLAFDTATGALTGTPAAGDIGMHRGIIISVSDGSDDTLLPAFDLSVTRNTSNAAPVISGTPPDQVTVGSSYDFVPVASDADGDTLTFAGANIPSWATFDSSTGRISGTPATADIGIYGNITINVSDGLASAALGPFTILVNAPASTNTPPTISGTPPASVVAGSAYSFQPSASDADGDALTFIIVNQPAWTTFDSQTGALTGIPGAGDVGVHSGISIIANDGTASASIGPFDILVSASNSAPVISGTPGASVVEGSAYAFQPTASDPDGDALTFSIANQPSWATFDSLTGALQGTPASSDIGLYTGITVTVTDGALTDTLGPFDIDVLPVATGSATLTWAAPSSYTDGSALTDLAGYEVHWGQSSGNYTDSVVLANPTLTTYVVGNLISGTTYYFATKSYNQKGVRSSFSNEASMTIP